MSFEYATDKDFWADFRLFNSFFGTYKWQDTKAAKDHIDEFGCAVSKGEIYFTRESGQDYTKFKISRGSMEQMLMTFFHGNQFARHVANNLIEYHEEQLAARIKKALAR